MILPSAIEIHQIEITWPACVPRPIIILDLEPGAWQIPDKNATDKIGRLGDDESLEILGIAMVRAI
jgi:hypothetical protein